MRTPATPNVGILGDLLGNSSEKPADGVLKLVDPQIIEVAPQARTSFDEEELANLRESIAETRKAGLGIEGTGILQPLTARRIAGGDTLRLIAGERRLRAARVLGLPFVPVIVSGVLEDEDAAALQLVENLQRSDLKPLEEARALDALKKARGFSIRDLATAVGKGKGYIEHRLALLNVGKDVQLVVEHRPEKASIAREIDGVKVPEARAVIVQAAQDGATDAEIRRKIEETKENPAVSAPRQPGLEIEDGKPALSLVPKAGDNETHTRSDVATLPRLPKLVGDQLVLAHTALRAAAQGLERLEIAPQDAGFYAGLLQETERELKRAKAAFKKETKQTEETKGSKNA